VGLLSLILGLNCYKVKDYTRYFLTYIVVLDRDIPQEQLSNPLGFEWDGEIQYSSNYFAKFYEYAIELINKELAYVCFLNAEQTREYHNS
jgi:hypothetical protein